MKFQRSPYCSRWGVLDGNLFALFGDLVNAIGNVCDVEFEVEAARFGVPDSQPRGEIAGEMLLEPRTVFHDRSAAVAHGCSAPESTPAIVIEKLRRTCVRLVKGRDDPLACHQGFVSGKAASDRPVEICPR